MNYRIETKGAFRIVGKSYPLSQEIEQNFLEVPQMWDGAVEDGTIKKNHFTDGCTAPGSLRRKRLQ